MATAKEIKNTVRSLLAETEQSMDSYETFFIPILNTLIIENTVHDKRLKELKGVVTDIGYEKVEEPDDVIYFEDEIALGVLPYGVAAYLLVESDPQRSGVFLNIYRQMQNKHNKASLKAIREVY